jgi:hypothetical protein
LPSKATVEAKWGFEMQQDPIVPMPGAGSTTTSRRRVMLGVVAAAAIIGGVLVIGSQRSSDVAGGDPEVFNLARDHQLSESLTTTVLTPKLIPANEVHAAVEADNLDPASKAALEKVAADSSLMVLTVRDYAAPDGDTVQVTVGDLSMTVQTSNSPIVLAVPRAAVVQITGARAGRNTGEYTIEVGNGSQVVRLPSEPLVHGQTLNVQFQ